MKKIGNILLAGIIFFSVLILKAQQQKDAEITFLLGRLDIKHTDGKVEKARLGSKVYTGDILKSYPKTRATVKLPTSVTFQIKGNTVVDLSKVLKEGGKNESKVKLLFGWIKMKVYKLKKGNNNLDLETPTAVIGVRGTFFETKADQEEALIKVYEGLVTVRNIMIAGLSKQVPAGYSVVVKKGSNPTDPVPISSEGGDPDEDTTPPVITIIRPSVQNEVSKDKDYLLMFIVTDENLDKVFVNNSKVYGVSSGKLTSHRITLSPGVNRITIKAIDKNGNEAINDEKRIEYKFLPPGPPHR
ncbi:MAG: FecR domain-containing protein [Spirochaetes bacterium]|nr:FecR domain-containing protein [Spirochaetota bacterium]